MIQKSCSENACASDSLDLSFGNFTEELCLDNDRLSWEESLSKYLEKSCFSNIDDGNSIGILSGKLSGVFSDEGPELVEVDGGGVEFVLLEVVNSDTFFSEEAWVISVHGSSVVGQTTCITSTTGVLSVSTDSTSSATD